MDARIPAGSVRNDILSPGARGLTSRPPVRPCAVSVLPGQASRINHVGAVRHEQNRVTGSISSAAKRRYSAATACELGEVQPDTDHRPEERRNGILWPRSVLSQYNLGIHPGCSATGNPAGKQSHSHQHEGSTGKCKWISSADAEQHAG